MSVDQLSPFTPSENDVVLGPDGTWCFRDRFDGRHFNPDYYEVLAVDSLRWQLKVRHVCPHLDARAEGYGYLSLWHARDHRRRELQVLRSAAGYYLGTLTDDGFPNTRESVDYWSTENDAKRAMASGEWEQRLYL
jgi:hypothetical protein